MARFQNKTTHVVISVDDSKANRYDAADWDRLDDGSPEPQGYGAQKVAELRAEIGRRNEGREDDAKLSVEGNKAELIATLEADDEDA